MKAIRILLSIAMLIAAGLGAFNVIPLRTAYFTLIILVAITVRLRILYLPHDRIDLRDIIAGWKIKIHACDCSI